MTKNKIWRYNQRMSIVSLKNIFLERNYFIYLEQCITIFYSLRVYGLGLRIFQKTLTNYFGIFSQMMNVIDNPCKCLFWYWNDENKLGLIRPRPVNLCVKANFGLNAQIRTLGSSGLFISAQSWFIQHFKEINTLWP